MRVDTPAKIFDEVVNLCEWPTVLVGNFDEEFLAVPSEIDVYKRQPKRRAS